MRDCDFEPMPHAGCGRIFGVCIQSERCVDTRKEALVDLWARADVAKERCLEGVRICDMYAGSRRVTIELQVHVPLRSG